MLAYLVIREGSKWTDVFRLVPGQAVTIGRAPTNQIVVKDERCSRCHAEIFFSDSQWMLRDLDSRNGTDRGQRPRARRLRAAGRRHHSHRPIAAALRARSVEGVSRDPRSAVRCWKTTRADAAVDPSMVDRRRQRAVVARAGHDHASPRADQVSRAARRRRIVAAQGGPGRGQSLPPGVRVGQGARRHRALPTWRLAGLFEGTQVDAGALLVLPRSYQGEPHAHDLEVVAARTDSALPYHRVSNVLGRHRAARGRSGAGPQRDGRQHARQPRQQGRDPRHQRDLRADPPRQARAGADPSVFDQRRARARSRRSGIHAGRGRHRGRGARESGPARGTGRKPQPDSRREPATARTAGRAERNRRHAASPWPTWRRRSPAPRRAGPPC